MQQGSPTEAGATPPLGLARNEDPGCRGLDPSHQSARPCHDPPAHLRSCQLLQSAPKSTH